MKNKLIFLLALLLLSPGLMAQLASVEIHLTGNNNLPLAGQKVKISMAGGQTIGEFLSDANGWVKVKLNKNASYTLETKLGASLLQAPFDLASDEQVVFELSLGNSIAPDDGLFKLVLHVADDKGVAEKDTKISVKLGDNIVFSCVTDIDGQCIANIKQQKGYKIHLEKFGKTFQFDLNVPDQALSEYRYDITIKVIERYLRTFTLENVYFDYDKWDIKPASVPALEDLFNMLKTNPRMKVEVAGHTDGDGGAQYNMRLSQRRAESVKAYLVNKGIQTERIIAKGYGLTSPVASNDTPEGKAKNRRTEIRVIEE